MRSCFSPIAFAFIATSLLFGQATYRLNTKSAGEFVAAQRSVVGLYCRLDFDGNRFSDDGWQKMKPLVEARDNPDFPYIEIVSRFQIQPPASGYKRPEVAVTYTTMGRFDPLTGYSASVTTRDVGFRVEEKNGEVVISEIEPNVPRVSKRAAVQWLKTRLTAAQDPVEKVNIEKALKILEPATTPAGVPGAQPAETPKEEAK